MFYSVKNKVSGVCVWWGGGSYLPRWSSQRTPAWMWELCGVCLHHTHPFNTLMSLFARVSGFASLGAFFKARVGQVGATGGPARAPSRHGGIELCFVGLETSWKASLVTETQRISCDVWVDVPDEDSAEGRALVLKYMWGSCWLQ